MTGAEFTAVGHHLALAYTRLRPDGPAWLDRWLRDNPDAADELMEWELEGHPFTGLPLAPPLVCPGDLRNRIEQAVDQLLVILDRLDSDPDLEDGADAEPSLGAPEDHASQTGWLRGSDIDLEIGGH